MGENPIRELTTAFESLADVVKSKSPMKVRSFSQASAHVSSLIDFFGSPFVFVKSAFDASVNDLKKVSGSTTLKSMINEDNQKKCVKQGCSHTSNLLRIKSALHFVKVIFEQIIQAGGNSLREPAKSAYEEVFGKYLSPHRKQRVMEGLNTLPTKPQLITKLNEDEATLKVQMQSYISSSETVIKYIEGLLTSEKIDL